MMKNYVLQKKQKVLFCKKVGVPWHPWHPRCRRPCKSSHLTNVTAISNLSELKAVYFGLKSLCRDLKETHIKILTDNSTAVHGINNMGSCESVSLRHRSEKNLGLGN